ncbi:hypothetical protein JTB14_037256 [Gonioctena quinquepunctata]|nr:hypothetical protein JTB14_037256 [Gonioctena quinquepunctata]
MADNEQGPSTSKKPKLVLKNPRKLTEEELYSVLMASSDKDDELLREIGQLSDIDVHLEQGDSDSEEDSSDEDDTGNIFDFLRSKPNIYLNISSIDTFLDVKQETQDEVANSRSEIVPAVIYQSPVGGSYFAAPGMRHARKVAANVLTAHQLEVHNESRLIKSSFDTGSTGTQFEDYIEASCSQEQELLVCSDSQDASDSQHDDSMSSNYSSNSDINYDMLEPEQGFQD